MSFSESCDEQNIHFLRGKNAVSHKTSANKHHSSKKEGKHWFIRAEA